VQALNVGLKKNGLMSAPASLAADYSKGEKRGVPYCRPKKRVSSATPKTASEMSAKEKASKIREKKKLGQPKGKPRRVKSVKRKKK